MTPNGFENRRDEQISREAAEWRARMLEQGSPSERGAFEAWHAADPAHARAYAESARISALGARLPRRARSPRRSAKPASQLRPAFGFAAAAVLAVGALLWMRAAEPTAAHAAITNPGQAVRAVRLSDGSTIILDVGAELTVTLDGDSRAITLTSGRARFKVAPQANRPFSVAAGSAVVTARGTVFDVALVDGDASVWLLRGRVDVAASEPVDAADRPSVRLESGQAVRVRDGVTTAIPVDPRASDWPASRLSFDNAPLAEIIAVANRLGAPTIEAADDRVGALTVTGVLDVRDTRALARKLAAALDLRVEEESDAIVLAR